MPNQAKTIEALKAAGLREQIKVMIGGAPTTRAWADEIGADGYAEDAIEAVVAAKDPAGRGLEDIARPCGPCLNEKPGRSPRAGE